MMRSRRSTKGAAPGVERQLDVGLTLRSSFRPQDPVVARAAPRHPRRPLRHRRARLAQGNGRGDRKSGVKGKSGAVRVDRGGRRIHKKKKTRISSKHKSKK